MLDIYGVTPAVLVTAERPDALVPGLRVNPPLAELTRPDLSPICPHLTSGGSKFERKSHPNGGL